MEGCQFPGDSCIIARLIFTVLSVSPFSTGLMATSGKKKINKKFPVKGTEYGARRS